jgi:hypothetical protein
LTSLQSDIVLGRLAIALVGWSRVRDLMQAEAVAPSYAAWANDAVRAKQKQARRYFWMRPWRALRRRAIQCSLTCTLWRYDVGADCFRLRLWSSVAFGCFELLEVA